MVQKFLEVFSTRGFILFQHEVFSTVVFPFFGLKQKNLLVVFGGSCYGEVFLWWFSPMGFFQEGFSVWFSWTSRSSDIKKLI